MQPHWNPDSLPQSNEFSLAEMAGWEGFAGWLAKYGSATTPTRVARSVCNAEIGIELDCNLSAAFNFGYSSDGSELYLATASPEYSWLSRLPFCELIVAGSAIYLSTTATETPGRMARFPAVVIKINSDQMLLWRRFALVAQSLRFACLDDDESSTNIIQRHHNPIPIRILDVVSTYQEGTK
jgi:hypothetical protein